MEQLTKNQAVATSQEAVQNQNEPQLRDENAHNDKSVHGVLNPTYQAGLRRDAVQPDIEAERKKRDRSEERFSRNAETDLVCRLLLEKKNRANSTPIQGFIHVDRNSSFASTLSACVPIDCQTSAPFRACVKFS